jgi:hypothetical protein
VGEAPKKKLHVLRFAHRIEIAPGGSGPHRVLGGVVKRVCSSEVSQSMRVTRYAAFVLLLCSSTAGAATLRPATCGRADVGAAVNSAADGDIILIPAGSCTWTSNLTIDRKLLTIQGAGIGQTIIIDGLSKASYPNIPQVLTWITKDGGLSRLTGITFEGGTIPDGSNQGMIAIKGNSHQFRLDHCRIHSTRTSALFLEDFIWGVVDHNTFDMVQPGIYVFHNSWNNTGDFGDASWADPAALGTNRAIFIEDNTFIGAASYVWAIDGWNGSRVVFRHNTLRNTFFGNHGTESGGRYRSQRTFEVYDNTITFDITQSPSMVAIRGGTGVIYNNTGTVGGSGVANTIGDLQCYRANQAFEPWGRCGSSVWDGNQQSSGYPCLDQPGRGLGTMLSNFTPTPTGWPKQAADPIYAWNNTLNGSNSKIVSNVPTVVAEGRDFLNSAKPGYTPYTYPHPLVSGSGTTPPPSAPAAPQNVRVIR